MSEIEGIVNPPPANWDRYINNSLQTNRLWEGTPDGEYRVVEEFICNFEKDGGITGNWKEGDPPCQYVYSDTKVTVRSGIFDLGQLLQAARELKEKSHYWGVYLELARFVRITEWPYTGEYPKRCKDINRPGFTRQDGTVVPATTTIKCKRHKAKDMTDQEKAMWAEGLIMLSWGS